jgi:DNA-binding PadR family transcriptional regulator
VTQAEAIILGLVAEGFGYGYQMEQQIEARNVRRWAEVGFSSIYYLLAKLERQGLVSSRRQASPEGPRRRIYRISQNGRRALETEAGERLAARLALPAGKYVGLALAEHLTPAELAASVAAHRAAIEERAVVMASSRQPDPPWVIEAMFDLGARLAAAEAAWLDEFEKKLAARQQP